MIAVMVVCGVVLALVFAGCFLLVGLDAVTDLAVALGVVMLFFGLCVVYARNEDAKNPRCSICGRRQQKDKMWKHRLYAHSYRRTR